MLDPNTQHQILVLNHSVTQDAEDREFALFDGRYSDAITLGDRIIEHMRRSQDLLKREVTP